MSTIEKSYQDGYAVQNFMQGFLGRHALLPNIITVTQLYFLHLYYVVIQGGITSKILVEIEKSFRLNKKDKQIYETIIDNAKEVYEIYNNAFREEDFLKLFRFYKTGKHLYALNLMKWENLLVLNSQKLIDSSTGSALT